MDFNNSFKCRIGDVDDSHIQFNPKLWNLRPILKDTEEAMRVPAWAEAYAHVKENQGAWLAGSRPLPSQCPQYPPIRRMLLGVTSPVIALVLEPPVMRKRECRNGVMGWSRASSVGMWQRCTHLTSVSLMHGAERRLKRHPRQKPDVSSDMLSNVYTPANDLSRLKWPGEIKVVLLEVPKELRGGTDITVDELAPHDDESVDFLVNDELFYHAGDLTVPARPDSDMDMRQGPLGPVPRPETRTMIRWTRMTTLWTERKTSQVD